MLVDLHFDQLARLSGTTQGAAAVIGCGSSDSLAFQVWFDQVTKGERGAGFDQVGLTGDHGQGFAWRG